MKNELILNCLEYCMEQIENNGGDVLPEVYPAELADMIDLLKEESGKKEVYTAYSPFHDISFIMEDVIAPGGHTTELKGFYYGQPDEEATSIFYGKTKAIFNK